jgi:hypothetical protein
MQFQTISGQFLGVARPSLTSGGAFFLSSVGTLLHGTPITSAVKAAIAAIVAEAKNKT